MTYTLGVHPRRTDHPALLASDGRAVCTFAVDETRGEIAALLTASGLVLHPDNRVTTEAP